MASVVRFQRDTVQAFPLHQLVQSLTTMVERVSDDARTIETTLPKRSQREKLILRDVRAELSRLKLVTDETANTLSGLTPGAMGEDGGLSGVALPQKMKDAIEYCIVVLHPTQEKLLTLMTTSEMSEASWAVVEMGLAEHTRRINRARLLLSETVSSIARSHHESLSPSINQVDQPPLVTEAHDDAEPHATGLEAEEESPSTRMRQRLRRRLVDATLTGGEDRPPILLPYSPLEPASASPATPAPPPPPNSTPPSRVNTLATQQHHHHPPTKPAPSIPPCWILIALVFAAVLASTVIGVYFTVAKDQMGDGFTTASWIVGAAAFLLAGPTTAHYRHCHCWQGRRPGRGRPVSRLKTCWVLSAGGASFLIASAALGLALTIARGRMGDGFTAAGWIVAVGVLVLGPPAAYHFPHCRCWTVVAFSRPRRVRTMEVLQNL